MVRRMNKPCAFADEQSDDDNSEASAESVGGTIDWDIPLKLPRSVLLAAQRAREAEAAASAAVRLWPLGRHVPHRLP